MGPSRRLCSLLNRNRNKHKLHSYYHSKHHNQSECSLNTHRMAKLETSQILSKSNRFAVGENVYQTQNKYAKSKKFLKYRSLIWKCTTVAQIDKILQSNADFDISMYTAAIKHSSKLWHVSYVLKLANEALNDKRLVPNQVFYGTLFKAFNSLLRPQMSEPFLREMIAKFELCPSEITLNIFGWLRIERGYAKGAQVLANVWRI